MRTWGFAGQKFAHKSDPRYANKAQSAIDNEAFSACLKSVASPLRLSATPPVLRRAPPALGEHTDEVLTELGLAPAQIQALRVSGTV
jgi:crotonobetainyl-CoA:carnitine CoA-transferase CaiB-like acyl-CoA transferase